MTFKNIRNLLLINHNDGFIDEDEFVVLYTTSMHRKTSNFRTIRTHLLTWKSLMSLRVLQSFALEIERILKEVLQISDTLTCSQRSVCDGLEGLCVLLKRLSHPDRYGDVIHRFAKPVPVLSMITNQMIDYVCIKLES